MTRAEVMEAIRTLVIEATGLDSRRVIQAHPNASATRLPAPFIAVNILTVTNPSLRDGEWFTDTAGDESGTIVGVVRGPRVALVSLGAVGGEGYDLLEAARGIVSKAGLRQRQQELGVAVQTMSDVRDVPTLRDGVQYEQQSSLTMTVAYTTIATEDVSPVDTIAGDVSVERADETEITTTFEVP